MNYVDSLNMFGVEAKEIPSIKGNGAPTAATAAAVGCFYMDIDTGEVYKCTADADGVYTWEAFAAKAPVTEITILDGMEIAGFEQNESAGVFAATVPVALPMVAGAKYKVIWDGTEYICECFDEITITGVGTMAGLFLGNREMMIDGQRGDGEPFIVCVVDNSTTAVTTDSGTSHIVSLYELQEAPTLPIIAADDNDKFLCVVNGKPAWVAMTDVSKEGA